MSNNMGTQSASVYWTGYEIHSCLKMGATIISCVLGNGYHSHPPKIKQSLAKKRAIVSYF